MKSMSRSSLNILKGEEDDEAVATTDDKEGIV
jgi:hypothetical protein